VMTHGPIRTNPVLQLSIFSNDYIITTNLIWPRRKQSTWFTLSCHDESNLIIIDIQIALLFAGHALRRLAPTFKYKVVAYHLATRYLQKI